MKVPCLSTRVGFAAEFLPDGALMQPYSIDELERGLKLALADLPGLKAKLQPSFDLVAAEVTLEAMTEKVVALYRRVLAG